MITIKNYVKVQNLEEAYQLNQSKRNCIIGGMLWLRTGNRNIDTAIDLSALGLDTVEEEADCFRIGAMTTLRQLETSEKLNSFYNNGFQKAVESIIGVQFRNLATVGGSIWGRYGFSDVLTFFLSTESYVELFHAGVIPMEEFVKLPKDNDILIRIIVKKNPGKYTYESIRIQRTDFPVITCAVSSYNGEYSCVVGARPAKAIKIKDDNQLLKNGLAKDSIESFAKYAAANIPTDSNLRGSGTYRKQLIKVLTERCLKELGGFDD